AGLLLRTLINLQRVETGFNQQNLLLFSVSPGLIGYKNERLAQLYSQINERLESIPGVRSVTFSRMPLLAESMSSRSVFLPSATASPDGEIKENGEVYLHQVRENYLDTMEIPMLFGRNLTLRDDAKAPRVAVVNQTFAKLFFPDENPVGKRFG